MGRGPNRTAFKPSAEGAPSESHELVVEASVSTPRRLLVVRLRHTRSTTAFGPQQTGRTLPAPLHFQCIPHRGLAASPGSCGIISGRRPAPTEMGGAKCVCCCRRIRSECGDDRACGGDRRRRSDGADVGGRVGVGGGRRCHCRAARQPGPRRLARRRSAFTHHRGARSAWNRRSVPLAGAGGAGRGLRLDPVWTSATFPPGTTTGSRCGRTTSSASWPAGSASWRCRSIADVR